MISFTFYFYLEKFELEDQQYILKQLFTYKKVINLIINLCTYHRY